MNASDSLLKLQRAGLLQKMSGSSPYGGERALVRGDDVNVLNGLNYLNYFKLGEPDANSKIQNS